MRMNRFRRVGARGIALAKKPLTWSVFRMVYFPPLNDARRVTRPLRRV